MGKCCSKGQEEEEDRVPFKFALPKTSEELVGLSGDSGKQDTFGDSRTSSVRNTFDNTHQENEPLLLGSQRGREGGRRIGVAHEYPVGLFYDKDPDMWFRTIYVFETDSLKKQLLSLNNVDLDAMDRDQFEEWCDTNELISTKSHFENFKMLDYMPMNRTLMAVANKYEVKMHISDMFTFKGRGPYRAVTCLGRHAALVDRAINEYEIRLGKGATMPHLAKQWDNHSFPEPSVDITDHSWDRPFRTLKRFKPDPPFVAYWPYSVERSCPKGLKSKVNELMIRSKDKYSETDLAVNSDPPAEPKIDSTTVMTPANLQKYFDDRK